MPVSVMLAEGSFWSLVSSSIKASSGIENGILAFLGVCSILSWAIVIWKYRTLRTSAKSSGAFLEIFERADHGGDVADKIASLGTSPHALIFSAALAASEKIGREKGVASNLQPISSREERLTMEMQHATRTEFARMHRGMDILASIASATPFIGLLGTVLGIMATFQVLGNAKSASLNVVAPGIAAALIATAAGLAVAIPAVFSYNWLMARMDEQQEQAEMFIERMTHWLHRIEPIGGTSLGDRSEQSFVTVR
jgi:biopolymer transport protein TolQ